MIDQDLDIDQRKAVEADPGTVRIIAGPGSGKTRTLCARVCRFIEELDYAATDVLVLAFNVKACIEIRQRLSKMTSLGIKINVRTYHSLALEVIKENHDVVDLPQDFQIDSSNSRSKYIASNILEKIKTRQPTLFRQLPPNPDVLLKEISLQKNLNPDLFYYNPTGTNSSQNKLPVQIASALITEQLRVQELVSFDDLLVLAAQVLSSGPTLDLRRGRYRAIFVDEYQDVNPVQLLILRGHISQHTDLTVVGDDDQCIYAWRGADPKHLIDFNKEFPDSKSFNLGWNYRNTENILHASQAVIHRVNRRVEKDLSSTQGEGPKIEIKVFEGPWDERKYILDRVHSLLNDEVPGNEIAILCRTNRDLVKISADLQTSGLDVKGDAPIHGVEIKRTMAMLYTIQLGPGNPQFPDAIDLGKRRIKRAVYRQIFSGSLPAPRDLETGLREWLSEDSPADDIPTATKKELRNFLRNLDELREMMSSKPISPPQLIQEIMSRFLGKSYQMVSNEDQDSTRKVSPYLLVHAVAENEPDLDSLIITLEELRSAGVGDLPNAISLITIHRAKGLEFDHVFIPCIRDDTFPNLKVSSDLEHDYRLYYVAITRCKNRLVLSQYRDQKHDSLSLFLSLIPENLRNLSR